MPRQIKVTLRAVFQQPIGKLNPMGMKMNGKFPVEIFQRGEYWQCREIASPRRVVYEKLGKFVSLDYAIAQVSSTFETCAETWQMWGTPPNGGAAGQLERLLQPDEVVDLGHDKWAFRMPEDFTHIIHQPSLPPGQKVPSAACGASVDAKCFISNLANVEPSCKKCAEVWRAYYQEKSA